MTLWAVWAPAIICVISVIYQSGALVGDQKAQNGRLDSHDDRLDGIEVKLDGHSERIARAEAWREGYAAGSSKHRQA